MTEIGLPIEELDTPILWVDLDVLEQNIALLGDHFKQAGINWRPHTKGIKVPAIAHKFITAGAMGVTCAKLGEAEVMAAAGIRDILIANEVVGPKKVTRLVNLRPHADVKVAVDDETNIAAIGAAAVEKGVEVGVVVDVDTGMGRAGVAPGEEALALSQLAHQTPGVKYRGLMAWEGHTVAMTDPDLKRQAIEKAIGLLTETATMCKEAGLPVDIVSGGGSGSYKVTSFLPGMTEIQAGGVAFCDVTYQKWGVDTSPALFVRTMVTSRPTPERIIFDAGFKALPAWGDRAPQPIGLDNFENYRTSAEHGTVDLTAPNTTITVGDAFDFMVAYGDFTVFLHDQLYGVRAGVVETIWPILGRGKIR